MNERLNETTSIDILQFMLEIDPTLPRGVDDDDYLPIYYAINRKSTAFCKELINAYPESLLIETMVGKLPIHVACRYGKRDDTADTIQYMLELDPELINAAEDDEGSLPIHCAAMRGMTKSIELLLKFDHNAASKKTNDEHQMLPLHLACGVYNPDLSSIRALYDTYPEAILVRDRAGRTPLNLARKQPVMDFLQTELVYARQAQDMTAMATVDDDDGWLHRALKDNTSLGSIANC